MESMECTQKLECTQDLYNTRTERTDPEQVGFLGMCGTKYPIVKGPNKIGRDPKTSRIVLNFNSISRQHAVLNVLSVNECMLMDLDSSNKTNVQGKSLQPFIPHLLKNGDTVQFGEVFGVFRLLEEDDDLPMTQAFDIPCTPKVVPTRVPASPVASDIDDSFIMPSLPKRSSEFKSPLAKVPKFSSKTVTEPSGHEKAENAHWKSRKKSDSFNLELDESGGTINDDSTSDRSNVIINETIEDIHEMETQVPYKADDSTDSIYTANTQLPPSPSIHYMETQQPLPDIHELETQQQEDIHSLNTQNVTESVHDCETQVPTEQPEECQISNEEDVNTSNKENDNSIFNAETQVLPIEKAAIVVDFKKPECLNINAHEISKDKNDSDEEIVFDEISTQTFQEPFESQPLLATDVSPQIDRIEDITAGSEKIKVQAASLTDCDNFDILPTQKITTENDSLSPQKTTTDINILPTQKIIKDDDDDDLTDCEDEFINNQVEESKDSPEINFEDMATQVLGDDEIEAELNKNKDETDGPSKGVSLEDMSTQVITNESTEGNFEDQPTQIITIEDQNNSTKELEQDVYSEEIVSPFKVPFPTPLKSKKTSKLAITRASTPKPVEAKNVTDDDPNYYAATQDILQDLCSQEQLFPKSDNPDSKLTDQMDEDEVVPCSAEDCQTDDRFKHLENDLTPVKKSVNVSSKDSKNPAKEQLAKAKLLTNSDVDPTPKTPKILKIINAELPNSQEIKTSVTLTHKSITESSSDSESEEVSDQDSGITVGRKTKSKSKAKLDLTKKFDESLPTRIITRVRKPTYKIRDSDESTQSQCKSILKNSLFDSQESIDVEIINENLSRLQSKGTKKREKESNNSQNKYDQSKVRPESRNENKDVDKSIENKKKDDKSRSSRSKSRKSEDTENDKRVKRDDSKDEKKTRSTRSSRNKKDEKSKSSRDTKRESKEKEKERDKNESSPETEVRRSKRQRDKENDSKNAKHENSTVYMSSESSTESPKNLKRSATTELEVPNAKRTRSLPNSSSSASTATKSARCDEHYVLFTAFSNDEVRGKVEELGAVIVTDVMQCTVLVTLQIKRTFKLLCAVGLGRPVVGPDWVQACADTKSIVDPWQFIIKDVAAEKRFQFSLENTLRGKRNFLKGYNVSSTPSVLPNSTEMKLIVECSGGTWKADPPNWICISSSADKALWPALRRRGATVVSTEFILGGVLRQSADVDATAMG